jgi:hypothetical protein
MIVLTSDEVKPFLCHGEKKVREFAAKYFADSYSKDPELMLLILESCRMYGEVANLILLASAREFAQNEFSIYRILDNMDRATDIRVISLYSSIIVNSDINLLMALESKIRQSKNISPRHLERMQRVLNFASWDTERLIAELLGFYQYHTKDKFINQEVYFYGRDIVSVLADRSDVPVAAVLDILSDDKKYHSYDEAFMTVLAGELGLKSAIPLLINKLRIDADFLSERVAESLIKIGTDEIARKIGLCFPTEALHFRLFASGVLGKIKSPVSEEVICYLIAQEEDQFILTFLAMEACVVMSRKCLPYIRDVIDRGYDRQVVTLEFELYAACRIMQIDLPELSLWQRMIQEHEQEGQRKEDDFLRSIRALSEGPSVSPVVRFHPATKKVGRNEPCPCGSGKKYKKCCGK